MKFRSPRKAFLNVRVLLIARVYIYTKSAFDIFRTERTNCQPAVRSSDRFPAKCQTKKNSKEKQNSFKIKRISVEQKMPSEKKSKKTEKHKISIKIEPKELRSMDYYIDDRVELVHQIFGTLKPKVLKAIVPDFLKVKRILF